MIILPKQRHKIVCGAKQNGRFNTFPFTNNNDVIGKKKDPIPLFKVKRLSTRLNFNKI